MPISLNTLMALPLFEDIGKDGSALLAQNSRIITCKRGQFLFMHGDPVTYFYVICRGAMQVFRETPGGHEITSDILIAGEELNTDEMVTNQSSHAVNARAIEDTSLLEIPVTWMRAHLKDFDNLAEKLLASLSDRLQDAQFEAEQLSTMSAAQMVACYLKKLCVLYDFDPHGFNLPYTKTLIASRLRIEKETFSRTLQTLRDHGITVKGTHVCIHDMHKSDNFSCSECSVAEECETHRALHEKVDRLAAKRT